MNNLHNTARTIAKPTGVKSLKKLPKANSATPALPGVGLISIMTHMINWRDRTNKFSLKESAVNAMSKKFATKNLEVHDNAVEPKVCNQNIIGFPLSSLLVIMTSSPVSLADCFHLFRNGNRKMKTSNFLNPVGLIKIP